MAKTIRQLLDRARDVHHDLSERYEHLSRTAEGERVRLLLEYMSRHEDYLEQCLAQYEEDAEGHVLDYWMRFEPEMDLSECGVLTPDMSIAEVITVALRLDECLVRFYRQIAENATSVEVRELFVRLTALEKREELLKVRNAIEMEDL